MIMRRREPLGSSRSFETGGICVETRSEAARTKARWADISVWSNVLLTIGKTVIGFAAHSDALLADAAHSAADVAGSLAVVIGVRVARRPADREHPYGHGKAEVIAASIVAMLLMLAGLGVVYSSARAFLSTPAAPDSVALIAVLLAVAIKEWLYRFQLAVGKRLKSPALVAGAADHRSDVYSSVAAAAGIGLALVGRTQHIRWLLYADPLAGVMVAAVVVLVGYRLARESFTLLMDQVVYSESTDALGQCVIHVEGVLSLDDLRVRSAGSYWMVDVKIGVDPEITVREGHDVARAVKLEIMRQFAQVSDVLVHVNPRQD